MEYLIESYDNTLMGEIHSLLRVIVVVIILIHFSSIQPGQKAITHSSFILSPQQPVEDNQGEIKPFKSIVVNYESLISTEKRGRLIQLTEDCETKLNRNINDAWMDTINR